MSNRSVLVLSGTYDQLFTYVIFASWLLYGMTTAAVLVLRRKRPDLVRPYRTLGYPAVPVLFVAIALCLVISTLFDSPRESLLEPREVGRLRLPSTTLGLLFHAAEHATRHAGQALTTARILTGK